MRYSLEEENTNPLKVRDMVLLFDFPLTLKVSLKWRLQTMLLVLWYRFSSETGYSMRSEVWDIILSNGNCLDSGNCLHI